jgi:hypothetical protein
MNRIVLGAFAALLLVASGLFWWQGRAETEQGAPPPELAELDGEAQDAEAELPSEDGGGMQGPALPEVDEESREERRFNRLDRNRDNLVSRNEILAPRVAAFRKLDRDGNNLLSFEEWAVMTANRFKGADGNGDRQLSRQEFESTKPKQSAQPKCRC